MYIPSLTDAMTSILRLGVHCRIPVWVIKYHSICTRKVYSNASRSRWQNEDKYPLICIEAIHKDLSLFHSSGTIKPEVAMAMVIKECLEDI